MVKNPLTSVGDLGSIPGLGISPGEGNGNPLQCPFLENLMDRGESHGQRSLVGCNPWGHKESGTTERLTLPYLLRNPGPWAESDRLKAPEAVLHQF